MAKRTVFNLSFYDGCIRTYGAATNHIMKVFEEVTGNSMGTVPGYPKDRFQQTIQRFINEMERNHAEELRAALEDAKKQYEDLFRDLKEGKLPPDVDDVPPSVFKEAIWSVALEISGDEEVDVQLDVFLPRVVTKVMETMGWTRRFNVGANRHFPRMVQWLREVEYETTWDNGVGLHLMNAASAGRVAEHPTSPQGLMVRINGDFL